MNDTDYPKIPPRLKNIHLSSPVYFVTCCTYERKTLLANEFIHQAFVDFVKCGFSGRNVAVGRYVLMPDHMHFFVRGPHDFRLSVWVNQLKGFLTRKIRMSRPQGDCYKTCSRSPAANVKDQVWQRGFFDHVLRSHESYSEKWRYVEQNPVRAGLVENVDDWPYAGQIMEIRV